MDAHGFCFILIVKLVVSVKFQCANLTRTIACNEGQIVYMRNIKYSFCQREEDSLYIACSQLDSLCNVTATLPQGKRDFYVDYHCSDFSTERQNEKCTILKPETNTTVSCPRNYYIKAENFKAYETARPCADRYFPEYSLYKWKVTYVHINDSSVYIHNEAENSALLLYNCSRKTIQSTDIYGVTSVRYYSQETYSKSFESYTTKGRNGLDGFSVFTTTESRMKRRPSIIKESKLPVGGIVGGVISFFVVLIVVVVIVLRRCRFRGLANKKFAEADVKHTLSNEKASTYQETKPTQNEYLELDPVEYKSDLSDETQNPSTYNYFILEKEISENDSTKFAINSKKANNGKYPQTLTAASDNVYSSNTGVYDSEGNKRNNNSSNNKQNLYDHIGTAGQDNSMYSGTYDHIDRCQRREDDDGVYDVGERNQTDDNYDVSGNFNRSLTQNDGLYDVGERKQTDDDYDVSGNFVQSRRENNLYSGIN